MTLRNLFFCTLLLIITSCKKNTDSTSNSTSDPYYFTASINGVENKFNIDLKAFIVTNPADSFNIKYHIAGIRNSPNDSSSIVLSLINYSKEIASPGTYPFNHFTILMAYYSNKTKKFYANDQYKNTFTVTIQEITKSFTKGTFSGVLIREDSADTLVLTNGQFRAPIFPL